MPDIKSILDGIIDGANNNFPNTMNTSLQQNMGVKTPQTFDAGKFREKLSLYVLKDVISAMMADDTKDLDGMIDQSIMRHIRDKYGCGCYDYLCKASKVLPSPTLSGIIQEIDKKTMEVKTKVGDTKDDSFVDDEANMKEELKNCESWEELREMLRENVSKKVVEDVAEVISNSNHAATFDNVDDYLEKRPAKAPDEDATTESVIMRMCGRIVSEGAIHGVQLSVEDGLERAITEYCIAHMDYLFKMDPIMSGLMFWDTKRPIQESFFDMYKDGSLVTQEQEDPKLAAERERYAKMEADRKERTAKQNAEYEAKKKAKWDAENTAERERYAKMEADRKERTAKQNAEYEAKKKAKWDAENTVDPKLAAERERYAKMFAKSKGVQSVEEEAEEYSDDSFE